MRELNNGFVHFMCKLDGKPLPKENKRKYSTLSVDGVDLCSCCEDDPYILLDVLDGDYEYLSDTFLWRTTPQGHDYWVLREQGIEPMSEEDYAFVRAVYERYFG